MVETLVAHSNGLSPEATSQPVVGTPKELFSQFEIVASKLKYYRPVARETFPCQLPTDLRNPQSSQIERNVNVCGLVQHLGGDGKVVQVFSGGVTVDDNTSFAFSHIGAERVITQLGKPDPDGTINVVTRFSVEQGQQNPKVQQALTTLTPILQALDKVLQKAV